MNSLPVGLNCDFDSGRLCQGVKQRSDDKFDWTVRRGSTPSSETGPSADVSGNGMLIASSDFNVNVDNILYWKFILVN